MLVKWAIARLKKKAIQLTGMIRSKIHSEAWKK